jgi:hypothetical protein
MVAGALGLQVTSADISRLSLESDNSSSDSSTDCALEENWHESNEVVEEGKNDNTANENDVHWVWHAIKMSHRGQKHPLNELCGLQKNVECVFEASLLFYDQHLIMPLPKPIGIQWNLDLLFLQ